MLVKVENDWDDIQGFLSELVKENGNSNGNDNGDGNGKVVILVKFEDKKES